VPAAPAAAAPPAASAGAGFRGARGGVHVLRRAQVGPPDADFTLEDLQGAPPESFERRLKMR
jgi:hypothetical protein